MGYTRPKNRCNFYTLFSVSQAPHNKLLQDRLEQHHKFDVAYTRNMTKEEIIKRSEALPQVSPNSLYNPIKKKLTVFLLDGDTVGKSDLVNIVLLVRALNILSKDNFYVIRNIVNRDAMSNLFLEINRDILFNTLAPTGTANKVDNLMAVELGAMSNEFILSGQEAKIVVVSCDKAVIELTESLALLGRDSSNISIISMDKMQFTTGLATDLPSLMHLLLTVSDFQDLEKNIPLFCKHNTILSFFDAYRSYMAGLNNVFLGMRTLDSLHYSHAFECVKNFNNILRPFNLTLSRGPRKVVCKQHTQTFDLLSMVEAVVENANQIELENTYTSSSQVELDDTTESNVLTLLPNQTEAHTNLDVLTTLISAR